MNAVDDPISAVTHIQKTAPGPPNAIALPTPMMLPVPIVFASVATIADQLEIPSSLLLCAASPNVAFSM